ncbi:MAG TPA: glycosyltransferase [Ohtaekwangia sp.]|nr:glycosyltransferase [Ohtaekwangia sp.]
MKVSLIISVYKNVSDLKVILDGLRFQTLSDFEVIISEDGNDTDMRKFIQDYDWRWSVHHIHQPDHGWRKNKALNQAILKSRGDYLIFIDGDCVLHHRFIEHHVQFAKPNRILAGKRVKLGPGYSALFRNNIVELKELENRIAREFKSLKHDGGRFFEEGIYINPHGWLRIIPKLRRMKHLKGCNMSFYRHAIERINGFDEDYVLPAVGEDADLAWRFRILNYEMFSLRNIAIQYHLHHPENWISQDENLQLMHNKIKAQQVVCLNGLKKYS